MVPLRTHTDSVNYTTHGDLWDYVYDRFLASPSKERGHVLLPLTLEISANAWYRKNPRQLLTRLGLFHPVKAHRLELLVRPVVLIRSMR